LHDPPHVRIKGREQIARIRAENGLANRAHRRSEDNTSLAVVAKNMNTTRACCR